MFGNGFGTLLENTMARNKPIPCSSTLPAFLEEDAEAVGRTMCGTVDFHVDTDMSPLYKIMHWDFESFETTTYSRLFTLRVEVFRIQNRVRQSQQHLANGSERNETP